MSEMKSRRELGLLVTGGVIAAGVVAGAKRAAAEPQPDHAARPRGAVQRYPVAARRQPTTRADIRSRRSSSSTGAIAEVDAGIRYDDCIVN